MEQCFVPIKGRDHKKKLCAIVKGVKVNNTMIGY
jgi:hypothetical protein